MQRAALLIAGEEYPDLDVDGYLRSLDDMAQQVKAAVGDNEDPGELARSLNRYFFDEMGFSGNAEDYYNPQNSLLNRVIDTRVGIPITLSVLYLGVAARLGLNCNGVGMPGHFLVKIQDLDLYMDPFHRGQLLSAGDCRRLAEQLFGQRVQWDESFLAPTTSRQILERMLNNLRIIYFQLRDWVRLAPVIERMLLIDPDNTGLYLVLARCQMDQGKKSAALGTLESLIGRSRNVREISAARELIERFENTNE
ncbi:MAG: transglutaminase-like domain-containing protein [Chloroflexota bacterium]|nr:transglutaminase-like domain-containing protein [Chloroflexota bacterium]